MAIALNTLTRQQDWAAKRLAQHAGKTVRIVVRGLQLNWGIEPDGQLVHAPETETPDVTLEILVEKISPQVLFDSARRPDMAEYIHVSGQAALAQVMSELARDLRPDPEEALSTWIGDIPARRAVRTARQMFGAAQSLGASLTQNLAEYLCEETDALVGKPAMTEHCRQQSELIASLQLLEQRHSRLLSKLLKLEQSKGARQ